MAMDGKVQGENVDAYLPVGTLKIAFETGELHYENRQLDIETGVHTAQFTLLGFRCGAAGCILSG